MAELPAFGSRLLILQCSELLLFQLGHWSIPTLSPNTRGTDCCDFHVTCPHLCRSKCVPISEMRARCVQLPPPFSTAPLWGSYLLYLLQGRGWDLAWLFNQRQSSTLCSDLYNEGSRNLFQGPAWTGVKLCTVATKPARHRAASPQNHSVDGTLAGSWSYRKNSNRWAHTKESGKTHSSPQVLALSVYSVK